MISKKTAQAGKHWFPGLDFTYCSGNQCLKRRDCKRWIRHYDVDPLKVDYMWMTGPKECRENDYEAFVEIN